MTQPTEKYVKIQSYEDVKKTMSLIRDEAKLIFRKSLTEKLFLTDGSFVEKVSLLNMSHGLYESKFSNMPLKNVIVNGIENASKVPMADICVYLNFINNKIPKKISGVRLSNETIKEETLKLIPSNSKLFVDNLLDNSSIDSSINLELHSLKFDSIEIKNSLKFDFYINEVFMHNAKIKDNLKLKNCDVVLINGSPQSVSEMDRILSYYSQNKKNCILISKSLPEDVLGTLIANYKMRTLNVIPMHPVESPFSINDMSDLSFFLEGAFITPEKGDIISSYNPSDSKFFDLITLVNKSMIILDSKANLKCPLLTRKIKRRKKAESEDEKKILNNRLKKINSNSVTASIYDDKTFKSKFRMKDISKSIVYYNNCCQIGMIEVSTMPVYLRKFFEKKGINFISAKSYNHSIEITKNMFKILNSVGCILNCD